jgi:uncharacterized protein YdiU (UPF0061 family)
MRALSSVIWIPLLFLVALSAHAAVLDQMSDAHHSLRDLGRKYYVDVPVSNIASKSHLLLFSQYAADRLGLSLPSDPKALEKLVLSKFAWVVDPKSKTMMMATRYLDTDVKEKGSAIGDGRVVWSGEFVMMNKEGKPVVLDVTLKGVGPTPLAWTHHEDPLHKDGFQSRSEAVHSFIHSNAAVRNGIDSTLDLAVIELPFERVDPYQNGKLVKADLTVRVGSQFRLAHLRYFTDDPKAFKKLIEYLIRRDAGLADDAPVGQTEVENYLRSYAKNLAEESARLYDLHAVHGSPTVGNRTFRGSTIDTGTFFYLDAHHGNMRYFSDGLKLDGKFGQVQQMEAYLDYAMKYIREAQYEWAPSTDFDTTLHSIFTENFKSRVADLSLFRLGLSSEEIDKIPDPLKSDFYDQISLLNQKSGRYPVNTSVGKRIPAAFELRKILGGTFDSLANNQDLTPLFLTDKPWGTMTTKDVKSFVPPYSAVIRKIAKSLDATPADLKRWSKNAHLSNSKRPAQNTAFTGTRTGAEKSIIDQIEKGEGWEENSQAAEQVITQLTDQRVEVRPDSWEGLNSVSDHPAPETPASCVSGKISSLAKRSR